jgi:16S rRNA G966 N2-methylase RsmD
MTSSKLLQKLSIKNIMRKSSILLDRYRGLDFLTVIQPEEVGLDSSTATRSSPSGNRYLYNLLSDIGITNNDSIIDIGCGKGSAMRTMLKYPFARVDGVEISEHIAEIARRNFKKLNEKKCNIFHCDASIFQHYGQYNMFYFYNPFPAEIMSKVISNISHSISGADKEALIIYNNPVCHDLLIGHGKFLKIKEYPDEWGNKIYIYSNNNK